MNPIRANSRVLLAALVGTAVEFYDFYVYATAAALVFGPLFFPADSQAAQTMFAFMSFGLAFLARPIGAIAFGHFGDRVGRKSTLVASLLLMGTSTLLIAFLPTHAMIGWPAPFLLCVLRFGQGFGLGGEWGGAALLAVENAPKGWESRFGAAPQLGAPVGFLAANGLFLLLGTCLSEAEFVAWGWRVPFLASALLVGIGLWVRLRISETPAFRAALEKAPPPAVPIARLLSRHLFPLLAGTAGVVACFAGFYMTTAYSLALGTKVLGYTRENFLGMLLIGNCFLALGIVISAVRADRTSPARALSIGAAAFIALGLVFGAALTSGSGLNVLLILSLTMFATGLAYGPLGGWLTTLFPVTVRYSGISMAFNLGGMIGGAVVTLLAQWMSTHALGAQVGLLLSAAGLLSLLGLTLARPAAEA